MSFQRKILGICFIVHFSISINYSWYCYEDEQIMKIQWSYKHSKLLNSIKGDNLTKNKKLCLKALGDYMQKRYIKKLTNSYIMLCLAKK